MRIESNPGGRRVRWSQSSGLVRRAAVGHRDALSGLLFCTLAAACAGVPPPGPRKPVAPPAVLAADSTPAPVPRSVASLCTAMQRDPPPPWSARVEGAESDGVPSPDGAKRVQLVARRPLSRTMRRSRCPGRRSGWRASRCPETGSPRSRRAARSRCGPCLVARRWRAGRSGSIQRRWPGTATAQGSRWPAPSGVWLRNWRSCSPSDAWLGRGEREVHRGIPAIGQGEGPEPQDVLAGVDLPA